MLTPIGSGWFRTVEDALDDLDAFAGRLAMETGRFWQQTRAVDRRTSVDRQLLSDLAALERDLVAAGLDRAAARGLIGRSIFAQFLVDREIVTAERLESEYGREALSAVLRDRPATKRLFDWLRDTFNGDMFPSEGAPLPDAEHLSRVADFLDAVDPESGQGTLFPYQFDVIPVELISSIYEQFAHAEPSTPGRESETDVFYTRLSLVSLVLDEITDGLTGTETVLDLTCGSGVFLVEALRKLVALRAKGTSPSRETIRSTLHGQIYGVDVSEAAVRVAAFSLYLAALELDPDPQPPEALRFEPLIGRTLRVVRFVLEEGYAPSTAEVVAPDGTARAVLDRIGSRLNVGIATSLSGQRELRVHGRDEVVVIKPAARRHWMGVSALDDADAVVAESFSGPVA